MLTTYLAPFVPIPSWTSTHVTVLHFSWFSAMTFTVGMFVPVFIYTSYFPCLMTSSTTNGTLKRKKIINMYKFNYFAFKIVYQVCCQHYVLILIWTNSYFNLHVLPKFMLDHYYKFKFKQNCWSWICYMYKIPNCSNVLGRLPCISWPYM
jgi:hypothetical protein